MVETRIYSFLINLRPLRCLINTHPVLVTNVLCLEGGRYVLFMTDVDGGRPIIGRYRVTLLSNVERLKGAKQASLKVEEDGEKRERVIGRDGKRMTTEVETSQRAPTAATLHGLSLMRQSNGQPKQVEEDKTRHQHLEWRGKSLSVNFAVGQETKA